MSSAPDSPPATETSPPKTGQSWLDSIRWSPIQRWSGAVGLVAILGAFWMIGGLWGLVAWAVVAGSWIMFPPVAVVVLGHFALIALVSADASVAVVIPGEAALLAFLGLSVFEETRSLRDTAIFVVIAIGLGSGLLLVVQRSTLLTASLGVLVVAGTSAYLLHRYLLLELGLLDNNTN